MGRFDESVMFRGSRTTLVEVIDEASLTSSDIGSPKELNNIQRRQTFINELNMHSLPSHLSIQRDDTHDTTPDVSFPVEQTHPVVQMKH